MSSDFHLCFVVKTSDLLKKNKSQWLIDGARRIVIQSRQKAKGEKILIYTGDNDEIKRYIKSIAAFNGESLNSIAGKMGIYPQSLQNIFKKSAISLKDLNGIAAAIGYQLEFQLIPGPELFQDGPQAGPDQPGPQTSKPEKQSSK